MENPPTLTLVMRDIDLTPVHRLLVWAVAVRGLLDKAKDLDYDGLSMTTFKPEAARAVRDLDAMLTENRLNLKPGTGPGGG